MAFLTRHANGNGLVLKLTRSDLRNCCLWEDRFVGRSAKETRGLQKEIVPYLEDKSLGKDRDWFNLAIAQRWIFKKVLDLGWTEDRFATFDSSVDGSTNPPAR